VWLKSSIGLNRQGSSFEALAEGEVRPSYLGAGTQVYGVTVTPGAVSRAVDAIAAGTTIHSPTVNLIIFPSALAAGTTVHSPTVTGGVTYDSDAVTYFNAMSVAPDATRKGLLNDLITGLKTDGIWTKLDALYVMAAHDAQAARVNAKTPSNVASAVNSPTFTTDRGYAGNASTSYIDTNWNPSTAGGNFAQNSASMGVWSRTNSNTASWLDIGNGSNCRFNSRSSSGSDALRGQINNTTNANYGTNASSIAFYSLVRSSSTAVTGYRNSSVSGSGTQTSTSVTNANVFIGRVASDYSGREYAAAFIGGALDGTDISNLHSRLSTYLTAVGAI